MHKGTVRLLAMALAAWCSACSYIDAYRPAWTYPSPPQRTYYSSHRHRVHIARSHSAPHESSAATTADWDEPPSEDRPVTKSTAPAPAPASNPPVSLSLAGDSGDRERAQHLLENADANLHRARRQHLTADQKETYERASQLAKRAHRALAENDCAAASSLASKASSLASGISGR
jgi:hypothetical protein